MLVYNINSKKNEEELEPSVVDYHCNSPTVIPSARVASVVEYLERGPSRKEVG